MTENPNKEGSRAREDRAQREALDQVLEHPRMKAWVQGNPERTRRVEAEVKNLMTTAPEIPAGAAGQAAKLTGSAGASGGHARQSLVKVVSTSGMCPACGSLRALTEVRGDDVLVFCVGCGRRHENLLELVPAREVSPIGFLVGEQREALLRGGLLLLAWAGLAMILLTVR